jgi:hypothetical protein
MALAQTLRPGGKIMDNFDIIDEMVDNYLSEVSKRTTITKVTRQTKIDRAIGALATKYAKEANDPLYKKMVKWREKFFKFRGRIKSKYGARVRSRAIQGKGIGDMVKKFKDQKSGPPKKK